MREPIWPNTRAVRPRGRMARRRAMTVSTLGFTYYIYAEAVREEPEEEEEESTAVELAGDDPEQLTPESTDPEESSATLDEAAMGPARPDPNAPFVRPALRMDGGVPQGSWLITEAPVLRPLKHVRRNPRGRPPSGRPPRSDQQMVRAVWDSSRTCTMFPTHVEAYLPPGRYSLQANFEINMRGRGWVLTQMARLEEIEIEEGRVTNISLQVSTDGYVEVKPHGRVVFFLPPEAPEEDAPSAPDSAGDAPLPDDS